jgi:hypothetical protein
LHEEAAEARLAVPGQDWGDRWVPPRHALVWVRLASSWCQGRITAWIRPGTRPGWDCQIEPDGDSQQSGLPRGGRYVYDPAAIRPRNQQLLRLMQRAALVTFVVRAESGPAYPKLLMTALYVRQA